MTFSGRVVHDLDRGGGGTFDFEFLSNPTTRLAHLSQRRAHGHVRRRVFETIEVRHDGERELGLAQMVVEVLFG